MTGRANHSWGLRIAASTWLAIFLFGHAQAQDKSLRDKADALFERGEYAVAYPLYSQLASLTPQDHELNYRFGACTLFGGEDKSKAIGYLKFAVQDPSTGALAWYFLGRAYQLDYHFEDALGAFQQYKGTADKKILAKFPVDVLEQQCRNGKFLLSNLKDIDVLNKVQVDGSDFFRFYDLSDVGGKIVVTPDELLTALDRKTGGPFLTYLPSAGGAIYFSSYGKDGKTGKDIYRSEVLPTGGYSSPVKLAGYINTVQDEDFAVMAPDGKSFYFCSKGHNSMGGYDVFKSSYDKGMDVFSAPENMDFAINTPADELLYIVGPDGKQACFASNRDSKQGQVNVYRVSTTRTPVNITVFKGTYASAFDATDRRAHIVVEDGLTREKVADVNTDMNGGYLLALPRGGNYRFLVEGGPSRLAHFQNVEVPHSELPRAYRQEIQMANQGGEKLIIKNYFDEPLVENVMALAMDEIKRRAHLDITGSKPLEANAKTPAQEEDPLQVAGFDGTMTLPQVMELATKRTDELNALAVEQATQANAAYALAEQHVSSAETSTARAKDLVKRAEGQGGEVQANLLREASVAKQASQQANERARAAFRTARDLERSHAATLELAVAADKTAKSISTAQHAKDNVELSASLRVLKAALDKAKGPDRAVDEAERTRRLATEAATEATKKLNQANTQRAEEAQLRDQVNRVQRDLEAAKGGRKQEFTRKQDQLQGQLGAMHEEVEQAFGKARAAEADAALARGQAALVQYLGNGPDAGNATDVPKEVIAGLEQRLADVKAGNSALSIDPQYAPVSSLSAEEMERRTFDWQAYAPVAAVPREATRASLGTATERSTANAGNAINSQVEGGTGGIQPQSTTTTTDAIVPATTASNTPATQGGLSGDSTPVSGLSAPPNSVVQQRADSTNASLPTAAPVAMDATAQAPAAGQPVAAIPGASERGASQVHNPAGSTSGSGANQGQATGVNPGLGLPDAQPERIATANTTGQVPSDVVAANSTKAPSDTKLPTSGLSPNAAPAEQQSLGNMQANPAKSANTGKAAIEGQGDANKPDSANEVEEKAFLLANGLAELEQMRQGEKDRHKRDSLDQVIIKQRALLATFQSGGSSTPASTQPVAPIANRPVDYRPLDYDPSVLDEQLAEEAYPGFAMGIKAIAEGAGSATDKARMLHALEMALVDSIDARMAGRLALLEAQPSMADSILPQLDRWRKLKALHVTEAANALATVDRTYAASETNAFEDAQLSLHAKAPVATGGQASSATPHSDKYIFINQDIEKVYTSKVEQRSRKDGEAVAAKEQDLARAATMQAEIDSMEQAMENVPAGKAYDKMRERTDRKIDDLLIANVDMGQRMAFISRSEFDAAKDSAIVLEKILSRKGLAPNDPLLQLARSFQADAENAMVVAKSIRKDADRSEDALKRNSLYRQAYMQELGALRDMDRSHTVRNWLLSGKGVPGEALSYEQVEARMFPNELLAERSKGVAGVPLDAAKTGADKQGKAEVEVSTAHTEQGTDGQMPMAVTGGIESTTGMPQTGQSSVLANGERAPSSTSLGGRAGGDSLLLSGYLDKYYYLDPEERASVLNGNEERQYFLMKGSSMEKRGDAATVLEDAEGSAELAKSLNAGAAALRNTGGASADSETTDRATAMDVRANGLSHRADSLKVESKRLLAFAAGDDAQAAALLQALPAERSSAIMGLEQGKRRTEPILARTRPASTTPVSTAANQESNVIPVATVEQAESRKGTDTPVPDRSSTVVERMSRTNTTVGATPANFAGPLTVDLFSFAPAPAPRVEPIAIDAPMPAGVVYKVQVGAFRSAIPLDAFNDMTPVTGERAANGLVRYTAGMFTTAESASEASAKVRARGYRDAFVAAYMDGKRIPLREAMQQQTAAIRQTAEVHGTNVPSIPDAPPVVASAPVELPQASAEAAVLANYPASAEALMAEFKPSAAATNYYNDPTAAPAKQVEMVKGLFFTVQVGVYSKPTPLDKLFNITPLNSERTPNEKIRYTTGIYLDEAHALARKSATVVLGVTDAFVTAYLNGKRIPVRDARVLLAQFGNAVLADPALATQ